MKKNHHCPRRSSGDIIRDRRNAKGLSQLDLAAKSGVPNGHIASFENGRLQVPKVTTAIKLARALGTTADKMFEGLL